MVRKRSRVQVSIGAPVSFMRRRDKLEKTTENPMYEKSRDFKTSIYIGIGGIVLTSSFAFMGAERTNIPGDRAAYYLAAVSSFVVLTGTQALNGILSRKNRDNGIDPRHPSARDEDDGGDDNNGGGNGGPPPNDRPPRPSSPGGSGPELNMKQVYEYLSACELVNSGV